MNPHFERASALLQTGRTQMAADELRLCLAEDPNFAPAHSMLALCLAELGQMQQAEDEALAAIGLAPDNDFTFYALGSVRMERNDFRGAIAAASEAVRLDPDDADNWLLEARARIALRQWHLALEAADRGLRCDPEHVECNNMRAFALVQLGRGEEAEHTLEASLNRDPENVGTHAHQGWALLNSGERVKALEHYREAMRLDPTNEFARMGIVETLKARNFVYRAFLRYFLFMSRQKGWVQWAIIIGVLFGQNALRMLSDSWPQAAPYLMPLFWGLVVLVLGSWMANPMFNLLLRMDREGRHALSETQIRETNVFGGVLLLGAVCALAGWVLGNAVLLLAGFACGFMLLPLACTFAVQRGWPRTVMVLGCATLALMGASIVAGATLAEYGDNQEAFDFSMSLIAPFLWGCVLSTWASAILGAFVPKR